MVDPVSHSHIWYMLGSHPHCLSVPALRLRFLSKVQDRARHRSPQALFPQHYFLGSSSSAVKGQHTVTVTNSPSGWHHTASAFASCLTWKRSQTSWGPSNHAVEFLLWKMMVREEHWPNSMLSLHGLASLLKKEVEEKQELIAFKTDSPRSLWSPVKTLSADLETWSYGPKLFGKY